MGKKITRGFLLALLAAVGALGVLAVLGPGQGPAVGALGVLAVLGPGQGPKEAGAQVTESHPCPGLPSHAALKTALTNAITIPSTGANGGLGFNMRATIVDRDGVVCAVAFTGAQRGDQWPGSRVISSQKANTANAFSLTGFALSTANLFSAVQPGGSLFGLQHSNPVDTRVAYQGPSSNYGKANDPMVGRKIGGVNVFGGGLALYNSAGVLRGGLGVSGDTSCADHNIAWKTRHGLNLDNVPAGVNDPPPPGGPTTDNIIYDITGGAGHETSAGGFGHAACSAAATAIAAALPVSHPVGPSP